MSEMMNPRTLEAMRTQELPEEPSNEKNGNVCHQLNVFGIGSDSASAGSRLANASWTNDSWAASGARWRTACADATRPESEFPISVGTRLDATGRRPERRDSRAVRAAQQRLSRHSAHLLGLRAGAVRSIGSGCADGVSGRPGFQRRERRYKGASRDGQSDLPARHSGDDRRFHKSGANAGAARTQLAGMGRPNDEPSHRIQHAG